MKHLSTFLLFISVFLFTVSCNTSSESESAKTDIASQENPYKGIPDFEWLAKSENLDNSQYTDRYNAYYDQNLFDGKLEIAAAYLIAYGKAMKGRIASDTLYIRKAGTFYKQYKNQLSNEIKATLSYFVGTQNAALGQFAKSNQWFIESLKYEAATPSHLQIRGLDYFEIAQNKLREEKTEEAERNLVEATKIFNEIDDRVNNAKVNILYSSIYTKHNLYDEAIESIQKALYHLKKTDHNFLHFVARATLIHNYDYKTDTLKTIQQIDSLHLFSKSYKNMPKLHSGMLHQFLTYKYLCQKKKTVLLII